MYKVIKFFTDLQDNGYKYNVGDTFPRVGLKVTKARLTELSTDKNRRGIPLIKQIEEKPADATKAAPRTTKRKKKNVE